MILQVNRNNRNTISGLRATVKKLYSAPDLISIYGAHVFCGSEEDVVSHFLFNHNWSGHSLHILFHCITIDFEDIREITLVDYLTNEILYLLSVQFQVVVGILFSNNHYRAVFLINGVSFDGRTAFHDCNRTFLCLLEDLRVLTGECIAVEFAGNVLFKNIDRNRENYISNYQGGCNR